MSDFSDLGAIQTLAGTALVTNYTASSTVVYPSACSLTRCVIAITCKAATGVTSVVVKMQGSYDGTNYVDILGYKDNDNTSQPEVEHTYSSPTAAATTYFSFHTDTRGFKGGIRSAIKIGGVGASGDTVTISATAT